MKPRRGQHATAFSLGQNPKVFNAYQHVNEKLAIMEAGTGICVWRSNACYGEGALNDQERESAASSMRENGATQIT